MPVQDSQYNTGYPNQQKQPIYKPQYQQQQPLPPSYVEP